MSRQQAYTEIIQMLYDEYIISPGSVADIQPIADKHSFNGVEVARDLCNLSLIQPEFICSIPKGVYCTISVIGIYQLNSSFIDLNTSAIIQGLGRHNGKGNIVEYYEGSVTDLQAIVDFAFYLRKLGYVRDVNVALKEDLIMAELTEEGWQEFQQS